MVNLISRLWNRKAATQSSAAFDPMNHELVRRVFGGDVSTSGKMVSAESSMTLSAVWSCQRILSETIGALPVAVYQKDASENAKRLTDHPLSLVLCNSPNANMTKVEFIEALVLNLCQSGNAYALVDRMSNGKLTGLTPIPSSLVTPKMDKARRVYYSINVNGTPTDFPQSDVWHVKGFGNTGLAGLSPIAAARNAMGMALSTEEFGAMFFRQGGKPSGIVTIPNFMTKEQRVIARENLQQMLGGVGNAHKFALFEGGMKPEPWGDMPLQDMEFLMLRKFNVQEICRFYRVPPHMVADLDKATFSNIEQQSQEFVQYTLMPYFTRIEASVAKWLLTAEDNAKGIFLRFNFEGLLRADSAARATFYSMALQNGWMTRNEVRAKENLNSDDALGTYTVQANMMDIAALPDEPPAAPAPGRGFGAPPAPKSGDVIVLNQQHEPSPANVKVDGATIEVNVPPQRVSPEIVAALRVSLQDAIKQSLGDTLNSSNAETLAAVKRAEEAMIASTTAVVRMAQEQGARTEKLIKENSDTVAEVTVLAFERSEKAIKDLAAVSKLPRRAVFDKNGEPIGTEVVERLH